MPAILIKPDGSQTSVAPANGKNFQLEELYKLLECQWVEVVWSLREKGKIMIVDEEGKLKSSPVFNQVASSLSGHEIVGNAIVCDKSMFK